ncbi:MAG: sulfatase-like hydrolase/transferase [Deltaproteobacteria bacterium]|nr:sulfatase-like hydrolase/transferase [Deltaproteobacteria bacterium]
MILLKDSILKGLLLGLTASLIVTFFDSLFMLTSTMYIPHSYPFHIIILNTLVWITIGGLSGACLFIFTRRKGDLPEKEDMYWVIFFLTPVTLLYGILGRLYIPVYIWFVSYGTPVFDHHLSFVWVALVMLFLIAYFNKRKSGNYVSSNYFIAELITIIILFQFCSNLKKYPYCDQANTYLLITVYVIGILLIGGLYLFSFYALHYFTIHSKRRSSYTKIGVLSIIVPICLISFYAWSHKNHLDTQLSNSSDEKRVIHKKAPQVILIVLDTVRADRLSLYSEHGRTKNLETFAQEALVFENCVAPSGLTIPSHASLFTGFYPREHGSHGNLTTTSTDIFGFPTLRPLSEKFLTLAEIFADNGYKTAAIVSNAIVLNPALRLYQGFQIADTSMSIGHIYHTYPFRPVLHIFSYITNLYPKYTLYYRTADDINRESINVLQKIFANSFFLFINYLDAHEPYRPPRPYHGYFAEKTFPQLHRLEQYLRRFVVKKWNKKNWTSYQLSQYDGEIAYLDAQLGKLFSRLKEMGIYDSSLIIVTSDHGELFGTHGFVGHRVPLYEGEIKVPLIIKFPFSGRVGREKKMISLCDLYPTILSICGLPIPDDISAKAFGDSSSPLVSELYNFGIGEHRIIYWGNYKYMRYENQRDPELYDLSKDPEEHDNLVEKLPNVTALMEKNLNDWKKRHKPKYVLSADEEVTTGELMEEQLKALGYIQ